MHPTHPRRRPWPTVLLLLATAVAVALLAVVLIAPPASAHAAILVPGLLKTRPRRPDPNDGPDLPGGP